MPDLLSRRRHGTHHLESSMARRKRSKVRKPDKWRRSETRIRPIGGVGYLWRCRQRRGGTYHVDQYSGHGELPFFSLFYCKAASIKHRWQCIGRFATLAEAKRACEQHKGEQENCESEQRLNEFGDPMPRRFSD